MGLNLDLLKAIARFHREAGTGTITLASEQASRRLQTVAGQLVVVGSTSKEERLGAFLVQQGLVDASLIEALVAEAQRTQRLLGAQILADGLMRPTDLASAIERQALSIFDAALTAPGKVEATDERPAGPQVMRQGIGAVTVAAFRSRLPLAAVSALIRERLVSPAKLDMTTTPFAQLSLLPAELRACRRLSAGDSLKELSTGPAGAEPILRLVGALVALEHWV